MKIFLRICSSVLLITLLCVKGYADEHFPFLAQVSKKSVNIRAGANTNFEILDQLSLGDEVVVLSKTYDWYKVQLPSMAKAFIRADYLKILQNSTAQLIGDKVNIRAKPDSNSSSLGLITEGTNLKLITQINGWWQIEPPVQAVGWIRSDFLTFKAQEIKDNLLRSSRKIQDQQLIKKEKVDLSIIEIKGKLKTLGLPKGDIRYELIIDTKHVYYIRSKQELMQFSGAIVLVKGVVQIDANLDYPLLELSSISLLL